MRIHVDPQRVEIAENQTFTVHIAVTNTGTVIGGYHLRILGADPSWVTLEAENLSLFPDTSQTVDATISIPPGVGAGDRRIAVQVQELTPPQAIAVAEIELVVPAREAIHMGLTPLTVVCGKRGRFSVMAENTGNTPISVVPIGTDPEAKIAFEFLPATLDLAPGEHVIADLRTSAKRRWFGSPVVRPFALAAVPPEDLAALQAPPPPADSGGQGVAEPPPKPPEPLAQGSIMQKPRLGRGALSLLALLLAVSVFAIVITIALSRLVGVSAADRQVAIQVATARSEGAGAGTSALGGTVKLLSSGSPESGVTVDVFSAGDLTQPIISAATNKKGKWNVSSLPAGSYKVRFRAAGFAEVWYKNAVTGSAAKAVQLSQGQSVTNLAVTLGGLPATISGQVKGANVAGAILTVEVPQQYLQPVTKASPPTAVGGGEGGSSGGTTITAQPAPTTGAKDAAAITSAPALRKRDAAAPTGSGSASAPTTNGAAPPAAQSSGTDTGGVLRTVPIGSDGMFTLTDLPSPAVYELVASKPGYATARQPVDLSGGESRSGVVLVLRTGDGAISGTISGPDGPLGGAVITATSGGNTVRTLSLTKGKVGTFSLRNLVTPASYTITVTDSGYTTTTSTLSLATGQRLTGVLLSLSKAAGSLSGMVTTLADGKPAAGVTVTITSGTSKKLVTVTQSGKTAGSWTVAGLSIPGTFTVTFSRPDLQSQTVAVAVNSAGKITSSSSGSIDVAMRSAYGAVTGTVRQRTEDGTVAVRRATVTLTSGQRSYTVTSVSAPTSKADHVGTYLIDHLVPGTYTLSASSKGTSPTTVVVTVTAGKTLTYNPVLIQPASVRGHVTRDGSPLSGIEIDMYLSSQYPGKVYAHTTTDANGHYSFTNVDAPQAYIIVARSSSAGPLASGTIVLKPSRQRTLNLTVGAPTSKAASPTTSSSSPTSMSSSPTTTSSSPTTPAPATTSASAQSSTSMSSSANSNTTTSSSSSSTGVTGSPTTTTSTSSPQPPPPLKITSLTWSFNPEANPPLWPTFTAEVTGNPTSVSWEIDIASDAPDQGYQPADSTSGYRVTNSTADDGSSVSTLVFPNGPDNGQLGSYKVTFYRGSESVSKTIEFDGCSTYPCTSDDSSGGPR